MRTIRLTTIICCSLSLVRLYAHPFGDTISKNSLLHKAHFVNSQYGEEGIIDAIIKKIGVEEGFLVEFGGYDGIAMSNTRVLAERGWKGAFIEPDDHFFNSMKENFVQYPKILCIKEWVSPFENDPLHPTIDDIANRYFPDEEIDIMSIDIDGLDHLIFKNLKRKPKLIIVEGGIYWHPMMQIEVPDEIARGSLSQPIIVMTQYAKEKGYELICYTCNAFFIRNDLYHHFADINNDPSLLWWEAMLHMKRYNPHFYEVIYQVRDVPLIKEWENKDPNIQFSIP